MLMYRKFGTHFCFNTLYKTTCLKEYRFLNLKYKIIFDRFKNSKLRFEF